MQTTLQDPRGVPEAPLPGLGPTDEADTGTLGASLDCVTSVVDQLRGGLPPGWEVYPRPYLNGLRPDLVLLHPEQGVVVHQVCHASPEDLERWVERGHPGFSRALGPDPFQAAQLVKQEVHRLYCPRLQPQYGLAGISSGVIFPQVPQRSLDRLRQRLLGSHPWLDKYPRYYPLVGQETLGTRDVWRLVPRVTGGHPTPTLAEDLRSWLVEPRHEAQAREPLKVTAALGRIIESRTARGYRRLRGAAGSGKTTAIVGRAVRLALEGKKVLVICFNLTLVRNLRETALRWPGGERAVNRITWLSFHDWCRRVCEEGPRADEYQALWAALFQLRDLVEEEGRDPDRDPLVQEALEGILEEDVPALARRTLELGIDGLRHDAILVDEGQDFTPEWWDVLRAARRPGGEMVLAVDATQDLYERTERWTDAAMEGAGFRGRWLELPGCHRLPPELVEISRAFLEDFLEGEDVLVPEAEQQELGLAPVHLDWVRCDPVRLVPATVEATRRLLREATPTHGAVSDLTVLVDRKETGLAVVRALEALGLHVTHTFGPTWREERSRKLDFSRRSSCVKVSTVHSYKGLEGSLLVVAIQGEVCSGSLRTFYTGITRGLRDARGTYLTVVSGAPDLDAFGQRWFRAGR
jgi:hypothetical protein